MNGEELLKVMLRSFCMIATGVVVSMYVFCLIFYPNVSFELDDIGRILLMAIAGDLPYLLFYSRKELSKKQMHLRQLVHLFVLLALLLYFARLWDWITLTSAKEVVVFLSLVLGVYAVVCLATAYRDKKLADKLNRSLKERYRS